MKITNCGCGHEKRDHRAALGLTRFGACKVCLCDAYTRPAAAERETVLAGDRSSPVAEVPAAATRTRTY